MKDLLKVLKQFTDKNNPKMEVNFTYYDAKNQNFVATEAKRMLVINYPYPFEKDMWFDVHKKVKNKDKIVATFRGINAVDIEGKFPNYQRIIPQSSSYIEIEPEIDDDVNFILQNFQYFTKKDILIKPFKGYSIFDNYKNIISDVKIFIAYKAPEERPILIKFKIKDHQAYLVIMPFIL